MRSADVISMLHDARRTTLESWADMGGKWQAPPLPGVNPPWWEMGHVAWFQEKRILRQLRGRPPIRPDADAIWDSRLVPLGRRWELPQPPFRETLAYMKEVLDRVLDALPPGDLSGQEAHLHWLAILHEDMHAEALICARQTFGRPEPRLSSAAAPSRPAAAKPLSPADADGGEGKFLLGAGRDFEFALDSEKWAHEVDVRPFRIARLATTNGEFLSFVEDGGYRRRELWSDEGWMWREKEHAAHPVYWIRMAGNWFTRHFDLVQPLDEDLPVVHVNWYEAEAYCRWARRRLPSEAEWELAASAGPDSPGGRKRPFPWGDGRPEPDKAHLDAAPLGCVPAAALPAGDSPCGCRQMIGNVWEWTSSTFQPYPGFIEATHPDYAPPAFGEPRKVLRGGSWATRSRLIRNTWRNSQPKDRRDIFAGFRTCALD